MLYNKSWLTFDYYQSWSLLQGYDVHMIIKALARHEDQMTNIELIPNSMEKYVSVKTRKFRLVIAWIISFKTVSSDLNHSILELLKKCSQWFQVIVADGTLIGIALIKFCRFIDSMQHLSASLDKLVKNLLNRGAENLKLTQEYIDSEHGGCERKFELLTRKGVYPYSYIDQVQKFDEGLSAIIWW